MDVTALAAVLGLAFPGLLVTAAACDLARYLIPNTISIVLAVAFVPAALAAGISLEAVLYHALAGLAVFAAGFVLFSLNVMGGGDVKLMAAAAAWTGWGALGPFLVATALAGGLLALVLVVARRVVPAGRFAPEGALGRLLAPKGGVPYASAIALGGLAVMGRMPLMAPLLDMF